MRHANIIQVADHVSEKVGTLSQEDRGLAVNQGVLDHGGYYTAFTHTSLVANDEAFAGFSIANGHGQSIDLFS